MGIVLIVGLAMQYWPRIFGRLTAPREPAPYFLDIGSKRDRINNPIIWIFLFLLLLFSVPFYRTPMARETYVGSIASWAFTSLFISGK